MNPRPWMTLVFLLSARSSLADVNQNTLTGIISEIMEKYQINGQFSLAANIPMDDPNNLHQVLQNNINDVKKTLNSGGVYRGNNVVIAKPLEQEHGGKEHAERRVLTHLDGLIPNARGNFLLIYSYFSPCDQKCTNSNYKLNIIKPIEDYVIPKWHNNVAFVFTKVFEPKSGPGPDSTALRQSLTRLGGKNGSGIGLKNIFRCDHIRGEFQCLSCSYKGSVSHVCVFNNFEPKQEASSSDGFILPRKGKGKEVLV